MVNISRKSVEEESVTLRSEEQNKSIETPLTSSSNGIKKAPLPQQQVLKKPQVPRPQPSSISLRSSRDPTVDKGLGKSVKNLFVKISIHLSIALTKLRFIADEILSSDEIENRIFYPTDSSSVLSELYEVEDQDQEIMTVSNEIPEYSDSDIRNIDIQARAQELRLTSKVKDQPFVEGENLWKIQNQQWLIPDEELSSMNGQLKLQKKLTDQELKHLVSTKDYSIVYNHLILKNKNLKKPMNLKDLLKVINAGWTVHKTWENAAKGV